ncbi:MAG: hypothetical protein LBU86_03655 [Oscillospiraceae bacterium]|jgi:hypothetical protein|nr:hypothetical protein [Oscillospiraceae bacterium]
MASTIYCSFTGKDFADFAAGRLTQEVTGIFSIRRVRSRGSAAQASAQAKGVTLASWGSAESLGVLPVPAGRGEPAQGQVTLKIICDTASRERAKQLLSGMHGYRITSSG